MSRGWTEDMYTTGNLIQGVPINREYVLNLICPLDRFASNLD